MTPVINAAVYAAFIFHYFGAEGTVKQNTYIIAMQETSGIGTISDIFYCIKSCKPYAEKVLRQSDVLAGWPQHIY